MEHREVSAEHRVLMAVLNSQRGHVLGILEGLTEQELRKPVLPTGWSCLGLVQHLALDVERVWFRALAAGQEVDLVPGGAWQVDSDVPANTILSLYRHETGLADAIIATTSLDAHPVRWPGARRRPADPEHAADNPACHDRNCMSRWPSRRRSRAARRQDLADSRLVLKPRCRGADHDRGRRRYHRARGRGWRGSLAWPGRYVSTAAPAVVNPAETRPAEKCCVEAVTPKPPRPAVG